MKKNKIYLIIIFALPIFIGSCQKDIPVFSGSPSVYFEIFSPRLGIKELIDTTQLSFAFASEDIRDSTIQLKTKITGIPSPEVRYITARFDKEKSTAEEGIDFESLKENYTIEPGKIEIDIPIHLKRSKTLQEKELTLVIKLEENKFFSLGMLNTLNNAKEKVSYTQHCIVFNDIISEPPTWNTKFYYWGPFSRKKLNLMNELTGFSLSQLTGYMSVAQMRYVGAITKEYLDDMIRKKTPVKDEDDSLMVMGRYII
ncbi:DUF4843 domain-containing protein [Sphingobacterium faecale]|uniref:DUF4843 domain-containing protein n=1 Tax=Sphingobacterium faecale TaxID=2803775 RepID=A0ABS1R7N0_9SPHI|nr:DUF4843 domain-containing protein [Sphingobacterium faecale]MBL1410735.1 DUF4843 domain-containing protein [Sphingobacterium faecale]